MKPEVGNTSVGLGKAFLRPHKDKGHYELMRPIVTVVNEGGRVTTQAHGDPIQLGLYRIKGPGDKAADMRDMVKGGPPPEIKSTNLQGQPITLMLVWWPGQK